MSAALDAEVAAISTLDLDGARQEWRRRYGAPPKVRSPDLLRRMLAWKIQVDAQGGLDAETLKLLRGKPPTTAKGPRLDPGTRLVREFKGERHEAQITADGVRYRGELYASLSEVARTITGVRWNGPRFFGLRGGT